MCSQSEGSLGRTNDVDRRLLPAPHDHGRDLVQSNGRIEEFHPGKFGEADCLRADLRHLAVEILPREQLDLYPLPDLLLEDLSQNVRTI